MIQGHGLTETSRVVSVKHSFRARRGTPISSETCVQLTERIEASLRQMAARRLA